MITPSSDARAQGASSAQTPIPVNRRGLRLGYVGVGVLIVAVASALVGAFLLQAAQKDQDQNPSVYALIRVLRQQPLILPDGSRHTPEETDREYKSYRETLKALLKRRNVLIEALHDRRVAPLVKEMQHQDALIWLEKNLRAEFLDNTELLRVSLVAGTPKERAVIVNVVTEYFLRDWMKRETGLQDKKVETLRQVQNGYKAKLKQTREEYDALSDALGTRAAPLANQEFYRGQLAEILRELRRIHLAQTAGRVKLARRTEKASREKDPVVSKLQEEIEILEAQEKVLNHEVESLVNRPAAKHSSRMEDIKDQIVQAEMVLRKINFETMVVEVNRRSEPRVKLIQNAAIRDK